MSKILVIDDEAGIRHVLSEILKKQGHTLFEAEDGKKGIEILDRENLDLVFLDIHLPDMDGIQVLEQIKKKKSKMPVVMCSGFGEADFANQAMKLGAFDYVGKPFKIEQVIAITKKAITSTGGVLPTEEDIKQAKILINKQKIAKKSLNPFVILGPVIIIIIILSVTGFFYLKNIGVKSPSAQSGVLSAEETAKIELKNEEEKKEIKNKTFSIVYSHPSGICIDGEFVWVCDWFSQSVYKHKLDDNMTMVKSYYFPDIHPSGIAIFNDNVWISDSWTGTITKHKMDDALSIEASYVSPQANPVGLMWDGVALWSCDGVAKKIYKHRLDEKLSVVASYDSPGESPVGLFWDGKNMWSADRSTSQAYVHNMDTNLSVAEVRQADSMKGYKGKLSGFTRFGNSVWLIYDEVSTIYRIEIQEMTKK
ncbi:MAG: hypothetical protein A2044_04555 [Candidatus Firestonebacteria bacterium GWA2_43_8]|nr:MAG: hypothetical protein A2044_04555 [Candidatus Firestonebacteria bacterium GWA2_43_8]